MTIGISNLAYAVRKKSVSIAVPVLLGHAHQLIAAALGYKSLAAYQAAQVAAVEPKNLDRVLHVVLDYDQLDQRASKLNVALTASQLHKLVEEAFKELASQTQIHISYDDFNNYLREHVDQVVIEDDYVNREMASANYDAIDEIYFDFEVEIKDILVGRTLEIGLDGHVGLNLESERPYSGHIVNVEGLLKVERLGSHCFGSVDFRVITAELDKNWGDNEYDDQLPLRSKSQAYAELLSLELHEVNSLVDAEVVEHTGSSEEMLYGYILDFTDHASPEIAQKILRSHSSLCIHVGPAFFEDIRSNN